MRSIESRLTLTMPRRETQQCCSANSSKPLCTSARSFGVDGGDGRRSAESPEGKICFARVSRHCQISRSGPVREESTLKLKLVREAAVWAALSPYLDAIPTPPRAPVMGTHPNVAMKR